MHHIHIDRFAGLSSPIHNIDPRAKLLSALVFIIIVVLTPEGYFFSFALYFLAVWTVIFISQVPSSYILKRSLTIIPFAFAISFFVPFITPGPVLREFSIGYFDITVTTTGFIKFISLGLKSFISFFSVITLVSSTRFGDIMWAAGKLGLPSTLVIIMSFMYRYLFILVDEVSHMLLARNLRSFKKRNNPVLLASGGIIGSLWVRSFEHADKLYYAMLLRGYSGHPPALKEKHLRAHDIVLSVIFIVIAAIGLIMGRVFYV